MEKTLKTIVIGCGLSVLGLVLFLVVYNWNVKSDLQEIRRLERITAEYIAALEHRKIEIRKLSEAVDNRGESLNNVVRLFSEHDEGKE